MSEAKPLQIGVATHADLPALHPVIERAYRGDAARGGWTHEADLVTGERTDIETLSAIVANPDDRLLIARDGDAVVGCVHLSRRDNGGCYLGLLCIDPVLQAGGYGKQLMVAAEQVACEQLGADHMVMTVIDRRAELIAYYERRGYARTGETCPFPVETDPPLSMVILQKPL